MGGLDVVLELALVGLLTATLLHAIRLQRALGSLRQDRAALHEAVAGFDSGTRQAEAGLASLRETADQLGRQVAQASQLRDDLAFFSDRAEALADRLDTLVRTGRAMTPPAPAAAWAERGEPDRREPAPSRSERKLLAALQARP